MKNLQTISLTDIIQNMSQSMANDPDILAMCKSIDTALHQTASYIPNIAIMSNLRHDRIEDSTLIDLLAWQLHVDFYDPEAPLAVRRKLTANSLPWHMIKGTPTVVEEVVTAVFSDAEITEWFDYGGFPYNFKISTEITNFTETTLHNLIAAIFTVKNTRSWLDYIEIVNRSNANWYAAIGQISEQTIYITLGEPIDTNDRPIIADTFAGVFPELDGYATVAAPDTIPTSVSGRMYVGIMPEFDGYVTIQAGPDPLPPQPLPPPTNGTDPPWTVEQLNNLQLANQKLNQLNYTIHQINQGFATHDDPPWTNGELNALKITNAQLNALDLITQQINGGA